MTAAKDPPPRVPPAPSRGAAPWYREGYVWLLIAIPASAVLMAAVMITAALVSDDGLVADDYYKRGLEIDRELDRDRAAARLELRGTLWLGATTRLELEGGRGFRAPAELSLDVVHTTRAGLDQRLGLRVDGAPGRYAGPGLHLPPGRWEVQVGTEQWRLGAGLRTPGPAVIRLLPLGDL